MVNSLLHRCRQCEKLSPKVRRQGDEGVRKCYKTLTESRVSTVAVQRFCKPKVGGSNPSPGTNNFNELSCGNDDIAKFGYHMATTEQKFEVEVIRWMP
jgi:hypothetical protein